MTTQLNRASKRRHSRLAGFTSTTQCYRYSPVFRWFVLTEATLYLAEQGKCFWLFDKIASLQLHPDIRNHPQLRQFQFWRFDMREDNIATLCCDWDKDETVYTEEIIYTDLLIDYVRIWVAPTWREDVGWLKVAFLPSEY